MTNTNRRTSLRDAQKRLTLDLIKSSAKDIFYTKDYNDVSVDEIAASAGVSRGTFYLHFQSKGDVLFDILKDDLDDQMSVYRELRTIKKLDYTSLRAWLGRLRSQIDRRRGSMQLFPIAMREAPERMAVISDHREKAVKILGETFPMLRTVGKSAEEKEISRAKSYMFLFQLEQVIVTFSNDPGLPDIEVGLNILADRMINYLNP